MKKNNIFTYLNSLFLAFYLISCAQEVKNDKLTKCSAPNGIYRISWKELAGTCGEVNDAIWKFQDGILFLGEECSTATGYDQDKCVEQMVINCIMDDTIIELQIYLNSNGDKFIGPTALQFYAYGGYFCASLYQTETTSRKSLETDL